ncbi:MAG TPA: hypothetical protein VFO65_05715 [Acidimicrobiales bacterium]|nr:hypothetical protein [Acidimicrobiales bacterium]
MASLDGRVFRDASPSPAGDVGADTVFEYREDADGTVSATYHGGTVRLGYLVGTRVRSMLEHRYVHLTVDGATASGHCHTRVEELPDGRLRLHEAWQWDSREGAGTSVVEEVPGPA